VQQPEIDNSQEPNFNPILLNLAKFFWSNDSNAMFDVRNSAPPQRSAHAGRNVACQVLMPPESSRFSRFAHLGFAVETKAPA